MVCTKFVVQCNDTRPGQSVWVVGAPAQLGSWQPQRGVQCTTSPNTFPEWRSPEVVLPPDFEFKLVIADETTGAFPTWEDTENKRAKLSSEGTVKCSWNCQDISVEVQKAATGKDVAEAPTATQSPSLMNHAWNLTQSGSVRGISGAEPPKEALEEEAGFMPMKRERKLVFKDIIEDCPSEFDFVPGMCPALKKAIEEGLRMRMKRERKIKGIIEDCPCPANIDRVPGMCPALPKKALEEEGRPTGTTREEKSDTLEGANQDCHMLSKCDQAASEEGATLVLQKWWSGQLSLRKLLKERMIQELIGLCSCCCSRDKSVLEEMDL